MQIIFQIAENDGKKEFPASKRCLTTCTGKTGLAERWTVSLVQICGYVLCCIHSKQRTFAHQNARDRN